MDMVQALEQAFRLVIRLPSRFTLRWDVAGNRRRDGCRCDWSDMVRDIVRLGCSVVVCFIGTYVTYPDAGPSPGKNLVLVRLGHPGPVRNVLQRC